MRITFISPLDNEFWYLLRQGVIYAKRELSGKNVFIHHVEIKEDVGPQIENAMKQAIENDVSGIIVPGFNPDIADLIEAAYQKNIPVMIYNYNLPMKSKSVAYCGPEIDATNVIAIRLLVKAIRGKGEVALVSGEKYKLINTSGRKNALSEFKKYRGIKIVGDFQCSDDIDLSYSTTKDLLRQKPNTRGILVNGIGVLGVAKAIEELGFRGKVSVVCFSFNQEIAEYIKKGIIYAVLTHDPFSQGHDPIIHFYNILATGEKSENENIWTRFGVIDKYNVEDLV